jgi:hypothetical protein
MTDAPIGPAAEFGDGNYSSQRSPAAIPPAGATGSAGRHGTPSPKEPPELRYARQTRNAAVFIAVLAGIAAATTLIGVIIMGVELHSLSNIVIGPSTSGSNCLSQGGTNPNC